jgi:hypothetical protein
MSITPTTPITAVVTTPGRPATTGQTPQTDSSEPTSPNGLVFSVAGASYKGQPIALSDVIDDRVGNFTSAQKAQAEQLLLSREKKGFASRLSPSISGTDAQKNAVLVAFYESYVGYLKNLSPAEQQSERYRGQLASARATLQQLQGQSFNPDGSLAASSSAQSSDGNASLAAIQQRTETLLQKLNGGSKPWPAYTAPSGGAIALSPETLQLLAGAPDDTAPSAAV